MTRNMQRELKLIVAFALGLITLGTFSPKSADAQEQIKPYVLVIFDISGSMSGSTGQGPSSCGAGDTRIDHAKCAIQQVVDAHAEIQFGMGRFRATPDGSDNCGACEDGTAIDCSACNGGFGINGDPPVCDENMRDPDRFQLLVPFVEDANDAIHEWVNFDCGLSGCSLDPADSPELRLPGGGSWTPLGGALRGAQRFFQGQDNNITDNSIDDLDSIYTSPLIDDPIDGDPLKNDFVSAGQQCRPYIVVLLTDGAETCEVFDDTGTNDTVGSAAAMLTTLHPDTGLTYRIETKPIGFGLAAGNAQIEAMARAGGNPGDGINGANEGFYANSELELINAFNQIISDSILVEICDGVDNDCDGNIDEGFQLFCDLNNEGGGGVVPNNDPGTGICVNPGDICDGVDNNCAFGIDDEALNLCGLCGVLPTEICNLSDDDCDGLVDEGGVCAGCIPAGQEVCNGIDEDCDGTIDEDITQACGTDIGVCTTGTETCVIGGAGTFSDCTGLDCTEVGAGDCVEICDNLDNDCNGTVDGFVQECNDIVGNNPPYNGPCQPGFQVCTTGSFGLCQGEIGPSAESCDLLDNDCDITIDEDTGGANCDSACGIGTTVCTALGALECNSTQVPLDDELCNNFDDDCDGVIDENVPDPIPNTCDENGTLCVPGVLQCIGGAFVCTGGEAPGIEVCDCLDNDCDDKVDEEPPGLCPTGSSCVDCQCAFACAIGEFPCPTGQICNAANFCVVDTCFNVVCPPDGNGAATTCQDGACVPACDLVSCPPGTACRASDSTCQFDDCRGFPERCTAEEFCVVDQCVTDACAAVDCPATDQYCFEGACTTSCGNITCPDGQGCVLGECQALPCGGACSGGQVCGSDGNCQSNPCTSPCQTGQICNPADGECIQDPCNGITCPGDEVCDFGTCYPPGFGEDAGPPVDNDFITTGGGGGCSTGGGSGGWVALLILLGLALRTRRDEEAG